MLVECNNTFHGLCLFIFSLAYESIYMNNKPIKEFSRDPIGLMRSASTELNRNYSRNFG
jgi:hypothetical protein